MAKPYNGYSKHFLLYLIQSDFLKGQITSGLSETLQPNLSPLNLKQFPVPLPPEKEQYTIVEEVERCLSVADEVEKTIAAELRRAERLRQSILKAAFSGNLVPQDPNDEPAGVLLERIKAGKQQGVKTKREAEQLALF